MLVHRRILPGSDDVDGGSPKSHPTKGLRRHRQPTLAHPRVEQVDAGLLQVWCDFPHILQEAVPATRAELQQVYRRAASSANCSEVGCSALFIRNPLPRCGFQLQRVVVDAAWKSSAASDQALRASFVDANITALCGDVNYMLRYPSTLSDLAVVERAVAINLKTS